MIERGHILQVIKQTKKAILDKNSYKLKQLSNKTIHSASIHQDATNIGIAVIIHSLSKIIERENYKKYSGLQKFLKHIEDHLNKSISYLQQNKDDEFQRELAEIRLDISKLSGRIKEHIQDVFKRASINKASRIYEHGISMEKTAKLLGVTIWELAEYSGQTGISDVNLNITIPIKQRIKFAMDLFS